MEVVAEMQSWGLENPEAVSELLRGGFLRGRLSDMGFLLNGRLKLGALSEFIVNRIDRCGSKYEYGFAAKGLGWVFDILRHRRRIIQPFRFYLLCWVLEATSEELRRFEARGAEITKMGQVPLSSMPKNISPDKLERIRKSFSDDSFTRCHDREGYHWLYANDRVWLHDYVAARPRQKKAFQRVDWYARDEILSQELIAAKTALDRVLEKPIKVTKTELLRRVTDSFGIARNPGRLPRSNELIHEFVESDHDFQLRNLHWVLGKRSDLIGCALSVILRACGIRVIKVTEYEVEAIMNELWKDDWHALKS
ncbi:TnsD family Tn7-like transposition protein [Pseudomonas sp. BGr12]|uniref:TnsD family Tn7-like transposition protein n=1 Tax=Pseudomonas sp. BGr12 TaxID=2936269 RepID=UPI002559B1A0|nr:TnsD family Tn7-like transposition protein [Pseudomonas sp. BJa5]MDL2428565.1 TnsD family Tn7-like transposition protein [Pseudomonas sp. BJa5]